ncbi:Myophilin [Exaiptasia diaphana]|nr:Myophilin [Exaiptasia diaphana]
MQERVHRGTTQGGRKESSLGMSYDYPVVHCWLIFFFWRYKWNNEVARDVKGWIVRTTKCSFSSGHGPTDFFDSLNSGVTLCTLANVLSPGSIKNYHKNAKMPFHKMENIGYFTDFVTKYKIPDAYKFVTNDLYTQHNMNQDSGDHVTPYPYICHQYCADGLLVSLDSMFLGPERCHRGDTLE